MFKGRSNKVYQPLQILSFAKVNFGAWSHGPQK
ncbi:hypothetical protein L485_12705 [Sphingobium baderi LL03]|uniref:Uncharacterized protein n=1 Tax=Sphingobium baderi LL03 TaxID=1114964 RepID=T0GJA9_9SPHN|nr:hypothetical protein L485_12705 [Sphingobium baderi LL03]